MSVFASCRRLRSPPDSVPTFFCWSADLKLYQEQYARVDGSGPERDLLRAPAQFLVHRLLIGQRCAVLVDVHQLDRLHGQCASVRDVLPVIILKSVVLPAPLAPTMPTTAPGGMMQLRSSMSSPRPS